MSSSVCKLFPQDTFVFNGAFAVWEIALFEPENTVLNESIIFFIDLLS